MASITKPSNGKRKYFYADTEQAVIDKLEDYRNKHVVRQLPEQSNQKLAEYLTGWLEEIDGGDLRDRTKQSYHYVVEQHIIPTIGNLKLSEMTPKDVRGFLAEKRKEDLSDRTVRYFHSVLRRALSDAVVDGLLTRNVAKMVKSEVRNKPEMKTFDPDEAEDFLLAAEESHYYPIYLLALLTGMRQGEILGLRWTDVDTKRRYVYIHQQLQRVDGEYKIQPVKSDRSKRRLRIPQEVVEALDEWKAWQDEMKERWSDRWEMVPETEKDLVFTTRYGGALSARNVIRDFKEILKENDLPDIRFHDLRHTTATLLLSRGVNLQRIASILGHSQIGVTMEHYAHVLPKDTDDDIDGLASDVFKRK